jgi:hypothetical protein
LVEVEVLASALARGVPLFRQLDNHLKSIILLSMSAKNIPEQHAMI